MHDPHANPDALIPLVQTSGSFEAEALVAALSDAGIGAMAVGPSALDSAIKAGRPGMPNEVRVPARDLEAAREALQKIRASAADLDWDSVDVGAPEQPLRRPTILPRILMWLGFAIAAALLLITFVVGILMVFA